MPALREIFAEFGIVFDRQRNLERGDRQVSATVRSLRRIVPAARAAATHIGQFALAAGGAATAGLAHIVHSTVDAERALTRWSGNLSINNDALRTWVELGREFGADLDDVTDALKEVQLKAQDALSGGTSQAEMFSRIGISLDDLRPVVNDADALMGMFIRRLEQVPDVALRNFTVDELMSDAGTRLNQVFALGSEEISRRRQALSQSIGPTQRLQRAIAQHARTVLAVTRQWEAWKREITLFVLPLIQRAQRVIEQWREPLERVFRETNILKGALVGLGTVAVAVAALTIASWGPIVATVAGVAAAVAGIALAYDQVTRSIDGAETALSQYLDAEGRLGEGGTEGLLLILSDAWDRLTTRLVKLYNALKPVVFVMRMILRVWSALATLGMSEILVESGALRGLANMAVGEVGEAARERSARPRAARERLEGMRITQEEHERRFGVLSTIDSAGLPLSVPGVTPTEGFSRQQFAVSRRSTRTNITAPMEVTMNISEAADAEEVRRVAQSTMEQAQSNWIRDLEGMMGDQETQQ